MTFQGVYKIINNISAVTWNGQDSRLTLHWENGFLLTGVNDNDIIWSYPYEKLRCSSDDAKRLLWLDFGGEDGEQVRIYFVQHYLISD